MSSEETETHVFLPTPDHSADLDQSAPPVKPADLRVWVVEDQDIFRELLSSYLATLSGVKLVGTAKDHVDLMAAANAHEVDLVILDLMLDGAGGLSILRELSAIPDGPAALVLSANVSEHAVFMAARLGARGFLEKTDPLTFIGDALRRIAAGGVYFSKGPRLHLASLALNSWSKLDTDEVSKREIDLLLGLINGLPIKHVAENLNSSLVSAYKARTRLMRKFSTKDDGEWVHYAQRIGLADMPGVG
jgi:DNA-binding NarL/FixJ family response regulator